MSESVKMPALGESVTEGTVSSWLKAVGDTVEVDEPLLEVATDKVDTEVPSPVAGTILEIRVPEDETVEVGTVLAIIGAPSEGDVPATPAPAAAPAAPIPPAPAAAPASAPAVSPAAPASAPAPTPAAAPAAPTPAAAPVYGPRHAAPTPAEPRTESPATAAPSAAAVASAAYVTPIVRKLARDKGIDLTTLTGTGVGGQDRRSGQGG